METQHDLETKAEAILNSIGLDLTTAYEAFLNKIIDYERTPEEIQKIINHNKNGLYLSDLRGIFKGQIWMSDDFNDPLDDFEEYM